MSPLKRLAQDQFAGGEIQTRSNSTHRMKSVDAHANEITEKFRNPRKNLLNRSVSEEM
jgi:hypothetical protein